MPTVLYARTYKNAPTLTHTTISTCLSGLSCLPPALGFAAFFSETGFGIRRLAGAVNASNTKTHTTKVELEIASMKISNHDSRRAVHTPRRYTKT